MNPLLKKVKDVQAEGCVTIMVNTHRTKPDNLQDPIALKNAVKEAETRLLADYDKNFANAVIARLHGIVESIDHNYNLESLVVFANVDMADYTRLPISVENRVTLDTTFTTRDLVRALHQEAAHYVLTLSQQQARLIEAFNDRVVAEIKGNFPLHNRHYTTDKTKSSTGTADDLLREFFNRVDKALLEATENHPLPVVVAADRQHADAYRQVADRPERIMGSVSGNFDAVEPHHIVMDTWKEVLHIVRQRQQERVSELRQAVSAGKFLSDYSEIWNALQEGRGKTLFVRRGFFQPAIIENGHVVLLGEEERKRKGVIDDIIDEMIIQNMKLGGDVVFLEGNELDDFQNLALVTRW